MNGKAELYVNCPAGMNWLCHELKCCAFHCGNYSIMQNYVLQFTA